MVITSRYSDFLYNQYSLHLLQNCLVYINTRLLIEPLSQKQKIGR